MFMTLRVPLIFSWPGKFKEGVVCESLAQLLGIYPTLAELAGLPRPPDAPRLAGQSLVSVLTAGKPTSRTYAISENWTQVSVIVPIRDRIVG
jgi:arylsulfatase A-like enzyme